MAAFALLAGVGAGFAAPVWTLLGGPLPGLGASHRPLRIAAWCAFGLQWTYLILARR
jgi:hypothetical protein